LVTLSRWPVPDDWNPQSTRTADRVELVEHAERREIDDASWLNVDTQPIGRHQQDLTD
jgi:hypothetical protein